MFNQTLFIHLLMIRLNITDISLIDTKNNIYINIENNCDDIDINIDMLDVYIDVNYYLDYLIYGGSYYYPQTDYICNIKCGFKIMDFKTSDNLLMSSEDYNLLFDLMHEYFKKG